MSDDTVITRACLAEKLRQWQAGAISTADLSVWAENIYGVADVDDREGPNDDSVANEVLGALDMLRLNLTLPEDIPIFLEFLATPRGDFQRGYAEFEKHRDAVDIRSRRAMLKNDPIYSPFCR
ncbi:MAG: hypothetical protein K8R36_20575 [Planctomycetales bacterium]|nr:hypothetical protein [Planctomycetales bacterium]